MAGSDEVLRRVAAAVRGRCGLPVLVPNRQGYDAARAAGAREIAVFTAASETFNRKNTNASHRRELRPLRGVRARGAGRGSVGARLRLHLLRLSLRGPGGSRAGSWRSRGGCSMRDATRSPSATPSGWRCPPRSADVLGRLAGRGRPRGPGRALPRHAGHGPRQRARRPRGGHRHRRQLGGRPGRLPLRAGGQRQPRHRGPALHAPRHGHRDRASTSRPWCGPRGPWPRGWGTPLPSRYLQAAAASLAD